MFDGQTIYATVTYLLDGDNVLLIYKKRGFGAGKYNGVGGKIEKGEDIFSSAKREVLEEIKVEVKELSLHGVLLFYSVFENPDIIVYVFTTREFSGTPCETNEAKPQWFKKEQLPWEHMWEDDRIWLRHVLDGKRVYGVFWFDRDYKKLLKWDLSVYP
ncbi:MAG: NUDIX hydrolase [Thermoprotei archaeon]|nr:MAG: NUDIX hydrolase [Thermoprotei archaeon]